MNILVTELELADRACWERLYAEYADFYAMPMETRTLDTVWSWVFDTHQPFHAFIARDEAGEAKGLMHCRAMHSPLRGAMVGFLDDLYVCPQARGRGCVQAMYTALDRFAETQGWPFVRWVTAENNQRARTSYDRVAEKTQWVTYQMPVSSA